MNGMTHLIRADVVPISVTWMFVGARGAPEEKQAS